MDLKNLLVDHPAAHVVRIRINRPAKLNAIDHGVREELTVALDAILADRGNRALVFGGIDGNLSAGGDVPSMIGLSEAQARARMEQGHRICRMVAEAGIPVVTAAEGWCAGASVGLAMLGDYIVGGPSTRFLVPFFKLGLVPDWGMVRSLPMRVGLPAARRMIFESRTIKGEEAERIGLLDLLVEDDKVADAAVGKAVELAQLPLHALALVKARWRDPSPTLEAELAREAADQTACLLGDEFKEGYAGFMEKRAADFIPR